MKKIAISLFSILLVFSLVGCSQKSSDKYKVTENESPVIDNLRIDIGNSDKFDKEEIENAIKIVKNNFNLTASTLKTISYNEEESDNISKNYLEHGKGSINGTKSENVIVLLTNFDVDDSGYNPTLNPGTTYEDFLWILIRDDKTSDWKIDDSGY